MSRKYFLVFVPVLVIGLALFLALSTVQTAQADIGSSTVTSHIPDPIVAGQTNTLCFDANLISPDEDYGEAVTVTLPSNWTVISVINTPANSLLCGKTTTQGYSGNVVWWEETGFPFTGTGYDPGSGCGPWFADSDGDPELFCVDVYVPSCASVPASIPWQITGDYWGDPPHTVTGNYTINNCLEIPATDLAVSKKGPTEANAGDTVTYDITVVNVGVFSATNVVVTDTLPYGFTPVGATVFALGDLAPGEVVTQLVTATIDSDACFDGKVNNYVEATTDTDDYDPTNNVAEWGTIVHSDTTLEITKTTVPTTTVAGDVIDFTIMVTNTGPGCATDVVVNDELGYAGNPEGLTMVDYSAYDSTQGPGPMGGYWYTCSAGGTCTRAEPMPAGTVDTISMYLRVPSETQGGYYMNFADTVWDSGSNEAIAEYEVTAEADLQIQKNVLKDELCLGAYGLYQIEVYNAGSSDAQGVVVTDTLPTGLIFGGGSPGCSAVGQDVTCTLGMLEAGGRYSFLIDFNMDASVVDGDIFDNTATVSSATGDPNANNNTSNVASFTAVQCFLPEADVEVVSKTFVNPPAVPGGGSLQFDIVVSNNGPNDAEGVTLVDTFFDVDYIVDDMILPAPFGTWRCSSGLTCVRQTPMPAGTSETLTFLLLIPPDAPAVNAANRVSVVANNPDPNMANNSKLIPVTVQPQADLTISKSGMPDPALAGEMLLYQIEVNNAGPSVAYNVMVSDTLPAGVTYAEASPECSEAGGVVTCNLGNLPVDEPYSLFIAVRLDDGLLDPTTLTNLANAYANDAPTVSTTDDTLVHQSALNPVDLVLDKSVLSFQPVGIHNGWPVAGGEVAFQIVITNTGPTTATDVVVYDQLPSGFEFWYADIFPSYQTSDPQVCTAGVSCALGAIPVGGSVTIELHATIDPGLTWVSNANVALVQSANPELNSLDNYDAVFVDVESDVNLEIDKYQLTPAVAGEEVIYRIDLYNDGPSDLAYNYHTYGNWAGVIDYLPAELDWSTAWAEISGGGWGCWTWFGEVDCYVTDMPAGSYVQVTIHADVNAWVTTTFSNTAYAYDYWFYETISDTVTTDVATEADLSIDKVGPEVVSAGDLLTYTITVHNAGPSDALNVVVSDTLPYGVLPVSATSFDLGTVPAGATVEMEVIGQSDPNACYQGKVDNYVEVTSETDDPVPTNNNDDWGTVIINTTTLEISKVADPDPVVAGDIISFTIVVTNSGAGCATDMVVNDELGYSGNPEGLTMVDYSAYDSTQGPGSLGGYWYTCSAGGTCIRAEPMPAGTVDTISMYFRVPSETQGGYYMNFADTVWDSGSNEAIAEYEVTAEADLGVEKSVIKDEICLGAYGFYQIDVTNYGASDAQGVVVTDTLPAELIFGGGSPDCTAVGQDVTCALDTLPAGETASFLVGFNILPDVISGTLITNTAIVGSGTYDPNPENNLSNEVVFEATQCFLPEADMSITKTMTPTDVIAGEMIHVLLTVTNNGPHWAEGVVVRDLLNYPESVGNFIISSDQWRCDGGVACFRQNPMEPGAVETIEFDITVDPGRDPHAYNNFATVFADNPDPDLENNYAHFRYRVLAEADLSIQKSVIKDNICLGAYGFYELVVTNNGVSDAEGVYVTDELPKGLIYGGGSPECEAQGNYVGCYIGDLEAGESYDVLIGFNINTDVVSGTLITNWATVDALTDDPNPDNNTDDATFEATQCFLPVTDMSLTKTMTPTEVYAGEVVHVILTVTNNGPHWAEGVVVRDLLYSGEVVGNFVYSSDQWRCEGGLSCFRQDPMAPGAVETIEFDLFIDPGRTPKIWNNNATVFADNPDPNFDNNKAHFTYRILTSSVLSIEKNALAEVMIPGGEAVLYSIVVGNDGPSDAYSVVITDTPDAGLVLVRLIPGDLPMTCGLAECVIDVLPAGGSVELYALVKAPTEIPWGTYNNTACVASTDNNLDNTPVCDIEPILVEPMADLSLIKTAPDTAVAGEFITYTLVLVNNGPSDAQEVSILDTLPGGVSFVSASDGCVDNGDESVTCTVGTLAAGDQVEVEIVVLLAPDIEPGSSLENTATASSITNDEDMTNNTASADTSIIGLADMSIEKYGPETVVAGTEITYNLIVRNAGPSVAQSVIVGDDMPGGLTIFNVSVVRSGEGDALCSGATCELGDVAVGEVVTITIMADVDANIPDGTILANVAQVTSDTPESDTENNMAAIQTLVSTEADVAVDKVDLADPVEPLEGFLYEINVVNDGPSDAQNVVITDTLDANTDFESASQGCVYDLETHTVVCTIETLASGEIVDFLLAVQAGDVMSGTILTNMVVVTSDTFDANLDNNTDVETTLVRDELTPSADVSITKVATPDEVYAGGYVTYTLTISNTGPATATDVQVLDNLPSGTTLVSIVADNPDFGAEFCTSAGICYLGALYANDTIATITIVMQVNLDYAKSTLTNEATVFADQVDHNVADNIASVTVDVITTGVADLALDKGATATVEAGGEVAYTLTVYNLGPLTAEGIVVTDTLPAGVTFTSADTTCTEADGIVVCTLEALEEGDVAVFTLVVDVDSDIEPGSSLENVAVVTFDGIDENSSNNMDTADTSIIGGADLALTKTGPDTARPGQKIDFTIVVVNNGPSTAQSVDVKDILPGDAKLDSIDVVRTGDGPVACLEALCQLGDVMAGEVVTLTVHVTLDTYLELGHVIVNEAIVSSITYDPDLSNNSDTWEVNIPKYYFFLPITARLNRMPPGDVPDLVVDSFVIEPAGPDYEAGELVTITVVVKNQGTLGTDPFWVDLYINPNPIPYTAGTPWPETCTLEPCYGIAWLVAGLEPGESITLTSTPDSYYADFTYWMGWFAQGTTDVYVYADSWSQVGSYGAIAEMHEDNNSAEIHGLSVTGGGGGTYASTPGFPKRPEPK